jgi:formylglycine-generating enzyme required for sulfatase activity
VLLASALLAACGATTDTPDSLEPDDDPLSVPLEEELIYVPAGSFYMGSPDTDVLSREDEYPQHYLRMDGFWIWKREVSNYQYSLCVEAGECSAPTDLGEGPSSHYGESEYANRPVVGVTWYQADQYCEWREARLPTEAEWEKTSRGQFAQTFPWGNESPNCDLTNMEGCLLEDPETDLLGQYPEGESDFRALDMSGNVWEWVADWYSENYYANSPSSNPTGPDIGEEKVLRGGSFEDTEVDLRSAARDFFEPDEFFNDVGFRCVPVGLSAAAPTHAPFCRSTYTSFCRTPGDDCTTPTTTQTDCPDSWYFNEISNRCVPEESGCPQTTAYNNELDGCEPSNGDCPEGWIYDTGLQTCQPSEDGCPTTTTYATNLNGCSPDTDTDCPDGWYYDTGQESCQPSGGGCPDGTNYNTSGQTCAPDNDDNDCPSGYFYDEKNESCQPIGTPGSDQGGGEYELLGFGCPDGNRVSFTLDVGANPNAGSFSVTVDNEQFNCVVDSAYPDRLICSGPAQTVNTTARIDICPAGTNNETAQLNAPQLAVYQPTPSAPQTEVVLAAYEIQVPELQTFQITSPSRAEHSPFYQSETSPNTLEGYCPTGYYFDEKSGSCVFEEEGDNCPDGWNYNPQTYRCDPGEDTCPPGTSYSAQQEGCTPVNGDCPQGYLFDQNRETCEPPGNNDGGGACPVGYFLDPNIHCCTPITTTITEQCEPGNYRDEITQRCMPIDIYGCGPNLMYDPYEGGCIPTHTGEDDCTPNGEYLTHLSTCVDTETQCPEGYSLSNDGYSCELNAGQLSRPSGQSTSEIDEPQCRQPGYEMSANGYCVPSDGNTVPGGDDCGPNGYFDPYTQSCLETGDECGLGYYFDGEYCRPTGGPGSSCGQGYEFHNGLNCCVPTPGNNGTFCVDGNGQTAGFDGLPSPQGGTTTQPLSYFSSPSTSDYDYGLGYCDPGRDSECPTGYHNDTPDGSCVPYNDGNQCPDGYHGDTPDGSCVPFQTSQRESVTLISFNPGQSTQEQTDCPTGYSYNEVSNGCIPNDQTYFGDECGEGYYFDGNLNYCVPTTCEGCALGYFHNGEVCEPYDIPERDGDQPGCPLGYAYDTGQDTCLPQTSTGQGCQSITIVIPACNEPDEETGKTCPDGYKLNSRNECVLRPSEVPDDPEYTGDGVTGPACSSYTSSLACTAASCKWTNTGTPPYYGDCN